MRSDPPGSAYPSFRYVAFSPTFRPVDLPDLPSRPTFPVRYVARRSDRPTFPVRYAAFGPPSRPTQHQVAVFPHLGTGSKSWQRYEAPQVPGAVAIAIDSARTPVTEARPGPKPELVDPSSRFSEQVNGAFRPIAYTLTQGVRKAEQRRRCPWTHPTTKARRGISFRA